MEYRELRDQFHGLVSPSRPNEWDIEDALCEIEGLEEEAQNLLLGAVPVIWPISHSLCFSFLKDAALRIDELDTTLLSEWIRRVLSCYEKGGLVSARSYMEDTDFEQLRNRQSSETAELKELQTRLASYMQGLTGIALSIMSSEKIYTDTETVYLPEKVEYYPDRNKNILFYKLVAALQAMFVREGTFGRHRFIRGEKTDKCDKDEPIEKTFFEQFAEPEKAKLIYQLMETVNVFNILLSDYPGLMRETLVIRETLFQDSMGDSVSSTSYHSIMRSVVVPEEQKTTTTFTKEALAIRGKERGSPAKQIQHLERVFGNGFNQLDDFSLFPLMSMFDFILCAKTRDTRIVNQRKEFENNLSALLVKKGLPLNSLEKGNTPDTSGGTTISLTQKNSKKNGRRRADALLFNNSEIQLTDDLRQLVDRIMADLGCVPDGYISSAFGIAGGGKNIEGKALDGKEELDNVFLPYDEWDYRRNGFRRNWCSLRETQLLSVQPSFVEKTLEKYRPLLSQIKKQFEMLNTQERFIRRRRYGDDIDLDAHIESLCDSAAGLAPSEKLFVRLKRTDRSISSVFLVDMSNSTEGWVGRSIKEALVLLCEAMETVGDPYAIYGFSGMRRMRSEVFRIKAFREEYTSEVKGRLSAISPKEYTRMGPPIRHITKMFSEMETKSSLLILLSDGKPEDYDDYKGKYAIEDTRKALAEAKGQGIHPYCITIDKEAHQYLEYLFGIGNYTFIKKIEQLPARLTEIYRLLTR